MTGKQSLGSTAFEKIDKTGFTTAQDNIKVLYCYKDTLKSEPRFGDVTSGSWQMICLYFDNSYHLLPLSRVISTTRPLIEFGAIRNRSARALVEIQTLFIVSFQCSFFSICHITGILYYSSTVSFIKISLYFNLKATSLDSSDSFKRHPCSIFSRFHCSTA